MALALKYCVPTIYHTSWKRVLPRGIGLLHDYFSSRIYSNVTRHKSKLQYEGAISTLNSLQSNAATLEVIRKNRSNTISNNNVETTRKYLERIQLHQSDLKKLNIIHISGTKGKGSTCAFVESILHEHGYKVGFYSSPHLVVARERIRISKRIISEKIFTDNFWDIYDTLKLKQSCDGDMPAYFKFLTLLAFRIFIKEKVDVAIIEVGIGGENDCTNVISSPVVCGITTLDLDHTSILGNTIEAIAWQKAGIMKSGVPTFTVDHTLSCLKVIRERALEKNSQVVLVPELTKCTSTNDASIIQLGLDGAVQVLNASLALQLAHFWMKAAGGSREIKMIDDQYASPLHLTEIDLCALKNVCWPGRSQVMHIGNYTYFIDGAHTTASISACVDWFQKSSSSHINGSSVFKILVFYITGDRDPLCLLQHLLPLNFDLAIFTTAMITGSMDTSSDQKTVGVLEGQQVEKSHNLKILWDSMNNSRVVNLNGDSVSKSNITPSVTFPYIRSAIDWVSDENNLVSFGFTEDSSVQILVTGSMHLVGGVLAVIDPEMSCLENPMHSTPVAAKQKNMKNGVI